MLSDSTSRAPTPHIRQESPQHAQYRSGMGKIAAWMRRYARRTCSRTFLFLHVTTPVRWSPSLRAVRSRFGSCRGRRAPWASVRPVCEHHRRHCVCQDGRRVPARPRHARLARGGTVDEYVVLQLVVRFDGDVAAAVAALNRERGIDVGVRAPLRVVENGEDHGRLTKPCRLAGCLTLPAARAARQVTTGHVVITCPYAFRATILAARRHGTTLSPPLQRGVVREYTCGPYVAGRYPDQLCSTVSNSLGRRLHRRRRVDAAPPRSPTPAMGAPATRETSQAGGGHPMSREGGGRGEQTWPARDKCESGFTRPLSTTCNASPVYSTCIHGLALYTRIRAMLGRDGRSLLRVSEFTPVN